MATNVEQQPPAGSSEGMFTTEILQRRADGVEKIMNNGLPREGEQGAEEYGQIWDKVNKYVMAVQSDNGLNANFASYLRDAENAGAFNKIIGRLKAGEAPANFIVAEEGNLPNRHYLSALMVFEGVAKAAIMSEGGTRKDKKDQLGDADLIGPTGETARRFIRVAEILDVESNGILIKNEIHPLDMKQAGGDYAKRFDRFAERRDVPEIYRTRAREAAANLRIQAMNEVAEAPDDQEERRELGIEDITPVSREQFMSAGSEEAEKNEQPAGISVALEYDPSHKILGQENPVRAEDVQRIQGRIEVLTRENTTQSAFEAAKLAALLQRAGIKIGEEKDQMRDYLQRQREAMQKHGPRALAQYLAYGKYIGCITELAPQEEKWLMAAIHDRLKNDPTHKGLTRLAMNARYLKVHGYTPDLVRQGVMAEIEELKATGDLEAAAAEAARARQAGVDPTQTFTSTSRDNYTSNLNRRAVEHASAGRWDAWAKLRNNLDMAWQQLAPRDKDVAGLIGHFDKVRSSAQESERWDRYAAYAADVREISDRDARRLRRESVAPVTPEVRQRGVNERARLTEREYEEYLGGAERAPAQSVGETLKEAQPETPAMREMPEEPAVTGGFFRRIWNRLLGRSERQSSSSDTPTDQAL